MTYSRTRNGVEVWGTYGAEITNATAWYRIAGDPGIYSEEGKFLGSSHTEIRREIARRVHEKGGRVIR